MIHGENAIEVKNIKKSFKVYLDKGHTLKEKILQSGRGKYEIREVIKDISFEVQKGEAIGLIGYNGCGKSTTLKLLTKIMYPDSGTIELCGRVSSLLELGAGFHPDMSGRENIYINASIFGLNRKEINRRINDIIAFSELEDYIDNPVRTYSSGMYMRLAFSVAINVNADILLIDEILAVGDVNFQAKCFDKLMEIKGKGTTIVLVSHSTTQIEKICERSFWIDNGIIRKEGKPTDVHREYLNYMCNQRNEIEEKEEQKKKDEVKEHHKDELITVENSKIYDKNGERRKVFNIGDKIKLVVELQTSKTIEEYCIRINLINANITLISSMASNMDKIECKKWTGKKIINIEFDSLPLLAGKYHFDLEILGLDGRLLGFFGGISEFDINSTKYEAGIIRIQHNIEIFDE